jgi:hypothetical protein
MYLVLADCVVVLHGLFILFTLFGALLVLHRGWVAWLHLPAAAWAMLIEFSGWICPLTPLEQALRQAGGRSAYHEGFIEHYLEAMIYPDWLTREIQVGLGVFVLLLNAGLYAWVWHRRRTSIEQKSRI